MANILIGMKRRDLDYEQAVLSKIKYDLFNEVLDRESKLSTDVKRAKKDYEAQKKELEEGKISQSEFDEYQAKYDKQLESFGERATEFLSDTRDFIGEWRAFSVRNGVDEVKADDLLRIALDEGPYNIRKDLFRRIIIGPEYSPIITYNREGNIVPIRKDEEDPYMKRIESRPTGFIKERKGIGKTPRSYQMKVRRGIAGGL